MKTLVVIPSRLNSTRLTQKPLIKINGKSLIQRVYEQVKKCKSNIDVVIATDSEKILEHIKLFNGKGIITSELHISGTDRCNEALNLIGQTYDLVINVQGDEPTIHPDLIDQLINSFVESDQILTPAKRIIGLKEINDQNIVKVDFDVKMNALNFYRKNKNSKSIKYKHLGIYAFKPQVLKEICKLQPTKNELDHKLEQLRWMDHNYRIRILETSHESLSIDTKRDLQNLLDNYSEEL